MNRAPSSSRGKSLPDLGEPKEDQIKRPNNLGRLNPQRILDPKVKTSLKQAAKNRPPNHPTGQPLFPPTFYGGAPPEEEEPDPSTDPFPRSLPGNASSLQLGLQNSSQLASLAATYTNISPSYVQEAQVAAVLPAQVLVLACRALPFSVKPVLPLAPIYRHRTCQKPQQLRCHLVQVPALA